MYVVLSIFHFTFCNSYFIYYPTGPEQSGQASAGAVANIRPKPRIAWHRRPLFSPGLDGDQLQVENLDGPGSEEWTFRESSHSQSVRIQLKVSKSQQDHYNEMRKLYKKNINDFLAQKIE